jgi:hypothetical protein
MIGKKNAQKFCHVNYKKKDEETVHVRLLEWKVGKDPAECFQ